MNEVTITGIASSDANDDRTLILLSVNYNNNIFPWSIRMTKGFNGSFSDFISAKANSIYADIDSKLQTWNNLYPKTREIIEDDTNQVITIPITREEIVKPTYPDYYVLRAREYPAIVEQLDAVWKGGSSEESMRNKIAEIKAKYPKS